MKYLFWEGKPVKIKKGEEKTLIVFLNGKRKTVEIVIRLEGENSRLGLLGFLIARKDESARVFLRVVHEGEKTVSDLRFRSILLHGSSLDIDGLVTVERKAFGARVLLRYDNLLLGKAVVNTKPELEVLNSRVSGKHGVTISKMDADQLFSLKTKGMDFQKARRMLSAAFLSASFSQIEDFSLKKKLKVEIDKMVKSYV